MIKLDRRVWFFLLGYISIIIVAGLLLTDKVEWFYKTLIKQFFFLAIIIPVFSSQKMLIGLKPNLRVSNIKFIVPLFLILMVYALWQSDFLNYAELDVLFIVFILMICFLQTLIEELIFRGILINNYLKNGQSIWRSVLYSSILFGAMHLIGLFGKTDPVSVINQVLIAIMIGIFLSGVFLSSKNIYVAGIIHMLINIPAYFRRTKVEIDDAQIEGLPLFESELLDVLFSSLMLLIIYSPFLIAGLWLLSKFKFNFHQSHDYVQRDLP